MYVYLVVVFMIFVMSYFLSVTESFATLPADSLTKEKQKNMFSYLTMATSRSPVGTWTQNDANNLQALVAMFDGVALPSPGTYYAQAFLNRKGLYSGKVDGVQSTVYVAALNKFKLSLDSAVLDILQEIIRQG